MVKIENCRIQVNCTMTWDSLLETADRNIKYCMQCDSGVHYCNNEDELDAAQAKGWCVAVHTSSAENGNSEGALLGIALPFEIIE